MTDTSAKPATGPIRQAFATRRRRQAIAAFAIIYAWEYLAFFSSALTRNSLETSPCLPEHCWAAAGIATAVCAALLFAAHRKKPLRVAKGLYYCAAGVMGACSLAIWALYTFVGTPGALPYLFAALIGAALPLTFLYRIEHFPDLDASFLGTFFGAASLGALLLYLVFILLPSICAVAFCAVAPLAFMLAIARQPALPQARRPESAAAEAQPVKPQLLNGASVFVLVVWLNFAFFRIIAAPWDFQMQAWYYPSVFVTTLGVTGAMLLLIRKTAARLHQNRQAQLAIVAFAVSYLILYVRYYNPLLATVAFSFCFACVIALEALAWGFWSQAVQHGNRFATEPLLVYLAAKGIGVSAGVLLGEQACLITDGIIPASAPILFLIVLFACGASLRTEDFDKLFSNGWKSAPLQGYETDFGPIAIASETAPSPEGPAPTLETGAEAATEHLARSYSLTPREADVAKLLLMGRSRPFIKDALFISMGTVNSHISSIYRKTGVSSQQAFISLADDLKAVDHLPR